MLADRLVVAARRCTFSTACCSLRLRIVECRCLVCRPRAAIFLASCRHLQSFFSQTTLPQLCLQLQDQLLHELEARYNLPACQAAGLCWSGSLPLPIPVQASRGQWGGQDASFCLQ